jgi:hypothetical protein
MKTVSLKGNLLGLMALLVAGFFLASIAVPSLDAQQERKTRGGGNVTGAGRWTVLTYIGDDGPFDVKADPLPGGGVFFNFFETPDRSMLTTDSPSYKRLLLGNLTGKTLYAQIEIEATPGATFNYYNTGGTGPAFVRFYFQTGKDSGWDPTNPLGEAQYWWSNTTVFPASIHLEVLASFGPAGYKLYVPLRPEYWSDRDGHMGTAISPINHTDAFIKAIANISKIGVSFGGGNNFAFGCGVDAPYQAKFKLYELVAK